MNLQRLDSTYISLSGPAGRGLTVSLAIALLVLSASTGRAQFVVSNLVTDDQSANAASITDPDLVNAWGISSTATSPFWVSDNATGKATLYSVNSTTNVPTKLGLTVTIPGDGSVTGQTLSGVAGNFNSDNFLFVSEDGTISGWRGAMGTTAETLQAGSAANVYKGAALTSIGGNAYLYAANFRTGAIDVIKGNGLAPNLTGNFTDPSIPAGYAPFDIQNLGGKLYVTYALQDGAKHDDVSGPGNGFVSVFDNSGNFLSRVASHGVLNSPWGMTIAPSSFGTIAGDLLVGNFGDGLIYAFNPTTFANDGALTAPGGAPIAIDGLWGLIGGNGGSGGGADKIYFSAGPDGESHGLFGSVAPLPEPSTFGLLALGLLALAGHCLRRRFA